MSHARAEVDRENAPVSAPAAQRQQRFLGFLLVVSLGVLWVPQIFSSLWIDEAYVYTWIKDGFLQALERGHLVCAAHVALVWAVKDLFGSSEWVLRLPSLLAAGLAVVALVRLGALFFDRETGLLAGLVFATAEPVVFAAGDARPYALALLATISAFYCLVRWVRSGGRRYAAGYVVLASLAVYFQMLFGVMFVVHGFYLWRERSRGPRATWRGAGTLAALVGLLLLPLGMETLRLMHQRQVYSFSGSPSVYGLALVSLPPVVIFGLLIGVIIAAAVGAAPTLRWDPPRLGDLACPVVWALAPPLVLFLVSLCTAAKLFVPRYAMSAVPGLALLVAALVRAIEPAGARRIVVEAMVFLSVAASFSLSHGGEDWRSAVAAARRYTSGTPVPVLVRSGTIEARDLEWLVDAEKRNTTLAPVLYYHLDGDLIPLPWSLDGQAPRDYMERIVSDHLAHTDRFVLIARAFGDNGTFAAWLRGRLGPLGFCDRSLGNFGQVEASLFERGPGACAASR